METYLEGGNKMKIIKKRKIVIPITLEDFEDAIERIKAEYLAGNLNIVGLFEIETLEYYYEKLKKMKKESEEQK